jgi:ATP-dependent DNA helicase RecQ
VSRTRIDATEANDGPIDDDLLANLKSVRLALARDEGVPAYVVASNRTLMALASMRPTTTADLDAIHGMGTKRIARYGDAFVNAVRGWTRC